MGVAAHWPGGADGEYAGVGRLRVLAAELHLDLDLQSGGSWAEMQQSGREWFLSRTTFNDFHSVTHCTEVPFD